MGEVWLARDLHLDRRVAIKILPAHLTTDADRVARLRLEARAASALNHPNVCTIHALGTAADGQLFLAMEYVEGATLRERLTAQRLPVREAIGIAAQIGAGLGAAHAAGVVHRDIKPENVMIRSDGLVKVLDFGLARLDPAIPPDGDRQTRTAIQTIGLVAGTIPYMSPEQAIGGPIDLRTDVFSLGAVLYEMVTGQPPFGRGTPAVVHDALLNRTPATPSRLNPEVPPGLDDLILKALEKDRGLRYQSVVELRTDLLRLQRSGDDPGPGVARATAALRDAQAPRRERRVLLAAGTLLVLGLAALAVIRWPTVRRLLFTPEWHEVQLTTNSSENQVVAASISPDGKFVAYADQTGLHLRLIDSGQTHRIDAPEVGDINQVLWFPDNTTLVVSGIRTSQPVRPAIWSISILTRVPKPLRADGLEACVSPDGSKIAFVDSERKHLWVMGANGEDPRVIVTAGANETLNLPAYGRKNSNLRYVRLRTTPSSDSRIAGSAESLRPDGRTTVHSPIPGVTAGAELRDDWFVYSLQSEPALNRNASLWEAQLDSRSGEIRDRRQIYDWPGSGLSVLQLSSSADGRRLAVLKRTVQKDVYVADLTPTGDVANPRRLTLDDRTDIALNWTPDGSAILFSSDRNGSSDIFRQRLDQRTAEPVIEGSDDETGPLAVSREGDWYYYLVAPPAARLTPAAGRAIMRMRATGSAREKIADDSSQHSVLCPRPGATTGCVLVEQVDTEVSVYQATGEAVRGQKLTGTTIVRGTPVRADLSPDGSSVAILIAQQKLIRVLPLSGGKRDVPVKAPLDDAMFFWSADSKGWYVSSTPEYPAGTELLHVDPNGGVRVIVRQNARGWISGIPSPDGRRIALTQSSTAANVWLMKEEF
jgi:eukaryotic-like serine/threonine-protein kinase